MECYGMTFVSLCGASLLLESSFNIFEAIQILFLLLSSWAPSFEDTLDWLQFVYADYQAGAYVMPASTVLAQFVVSKVDHLFPDIWSHLLSSYPGAYDPTNSTLTPLRA